MSKLFFAALAFSTVSLSVCTMLSLGEFLTSLKAESSLKIYPLTDPAVMGAYPGDDTDYPQLLKALAAIQEPISAEKVKAVLKKHAAKLYQRVEAAVDAYAKVRNSIGDAKAKNLVTQFGVLIEKYYLGVLHINEQSKEVDQLINLFGALNDEDKKVVGEKLKEALEAVEKALYDLKV